MSLLDTPWKHKRVRVQLQHYSFFNLDSKLSGPLTPRPGLITLVKEMVATLWRLGGPQCQSGSGRVTSSRTGVRTRNHPACSQSLRRLSYSHPL